MSGSNPFRRSKTITSPPIANSSKNESLVLPSIPNDAITSSASNAHEYNKSQPSPHPKVVRIASPPPPLQQQSSSPPLPTDSTSSYFPAVSFAGLTTTHRGSPPPLSPQPTKLDQLEGDDYSSSDDTEPESFDPRSSDGVVGDRAVASRRQQSLEDQTAFSSRVTPKKDSKPTNTLDVDAFTRLLLTGSAEAASTTTTAGAGPRMASSSDTISVTPTVESPNRAPTWASTEDFVNQEISQTDSQTTSALPRASTLSTPPVSNDIQRTSSLRKPKPPPPRSHRGKPIKPVESAQYISNISVVAPTHTQTPIGSPLDRRGSASSLSVKLSSPSSEPASATDEVSSLHQNASQSKRPPTPPLARRHSQMRPSTNRNSVTEKSHRMSLPPKSLSSHMQGPLSPNSGTKTPPRPPSRRVERPVSAFQGEALTSQLKSLATPSESASSDQLSVDEQPAQMSATSSPPSRTPSIRHSLSGTATITTGMLPPPPPPPRRLRASSKSSNTTVSVSTDKADAPSSTEQEDVQLSSHAQDIIADLSRLQREVDDLRIHYEERRISQ